MSKIENIVAPRGFLTVQSWYAYGTDKDGHLAVCGGLETRAITNADAEILAARKLTKVTQAFASEALIANVGGGEWPE